MTLIVELEKTTIDALNSAVSDALSEMIEALVSQEPSGNELYPALDSVYGYLSPVCNEGRYNCFASRSR